MAPLLLKRAAAIALVVAGVAAGRSARADAPRASTRLTYERGAGADACPDEARLRDEIAARLGYVPFSDAAPTAIEIRIARDGAGLRAQLVRREVATNTPKGQRVLHASGADCAELSTAVVLAAALAIDTIAATAPRAEPQDTPPLAPSPPPPAPEPARPAPADTAPPPAAPPALGARLGVAAGATVGIVPIAGLGPTLFGEVDLASSFSLGLDATADLPIGAEESARGKVRGYAYRGALLPCLRAGWWALCGVAAIGAVHGVGSNVDVPASDWTPWAALGARGRVDVPMSERIFLRFSADFLVMLTHTQFRLDLTEVWSAPPVAPQLTAGAGVRWP